MGCHWAIPYALALLLAPIAAVSVFSHPLYMWAKPSAIFLSSVLLYVSHRGHKSEMYTMIGVALILMYLVFL